MLMFIVAHTNQLTLNKVYLIKHFRYLTTAEFRYTWHGKQFDWVIYNHFLLHVSHNVIVQP